MMFLMGFGEKNSIVIKTIENMIVAISNRLKILSKSQRLIIVLDKGYSLSRYAELF